MPLQMGGLDRRHVPPGFAGLNCSIAHLDICPQPSDFSISLPGGRSRRSIPPPLQAARPIRTVASVTPATESLVC